MRAAYHPGHARPPEPRRPGDRREPRQPRGDGRARRGSAARQAAVAGAGAGGDERSIARHRERGKLPVRERIERLIDPGAAFLELSPLAADGLYDDDAPGAGIVTGIGRIEGTLCVIVANDATVKGGTYYPMTVKKHLRAQEIALENRLPCVYLVDSGRRVPAAPGRRLPRPRAFRADLLQPGPAVGRGDPAGGARHGLVTAGGAYVPAMSDETVIVRGTGTIFLGGPPLVKAATGEDVTAEELGGAEVHARLSGVADHEALDDEHALALGRSIVANLNRRAARAALGSPRRPNRRPSAGDGADGDGPLYDAVPADLRRPVDDPRGHRPTRRRLPLPRVQAALRRDARLRASPTSTAIRSAIIANDGILFSQSALKGAHFIELAAQRRIPLVFLQNITGFMVGREYEAGGIAKDGAKMVTAVACAEVPKFTVIVGGIVRGGQLRDGRPRLRLRASCGPGRTRGSASWAGRRRPGSSRPCARRVRRPTRSATRSRHRSSRRYEARGLAVLRDRAPLG